MCFLFLLLSGVVTDESRRRIGHVVVPPRHPEIGNEALAEVGVVFFKNFPTRKKVIN